MSTSRKLSLKSCAVRGPAGKSAYEAAVEAGYEGTAAEYYEIIGGIPDELTRINVANGRQDAILEYHGTQISALQVEDTSIKSRVSSLEAADSSMGATIQTLQDGLAQTKEIAEHPAFPEEGTNAHVVPKLETLTGNVKVLLLTGNNPDGLPHTFTPVIRNVAAPQLEGDAANKAYVDQATSQIGAKMNRTNPTGSGTMTMVANTMTDGLVLLDNVVTGVKMKASLGKLSLVSMSAGSEVPTKAVTISGLAAPDSNNDAANKAYVDQQIAALKAELLGLRE